MTTPSALLPIRQFLGRWKRRILGGPETRRAAYKAVWNAQAKSVDNAKIAVAGYTSETEFQQTAKHTIELLRRTIGIRNSDTILEIGAGVGRVGSLLAPMCKEWIGADVSENMLGHLRQRLADHPNVRTVALNGYDLSQVRDSSLDVVYCTVVFMHLDEWERYRYVKEAFRTLRPGGRLYVDNFNLLSEQGWKVFEDVLVMDPLGRPAHASKSSTPQELVCYLTRAGFQNIRSDEDGMWTMSWGVKPT
jgi:ubiquinone/menaquinone biosynthesis C-methylase UbiE